MTGVNGTRIALTIASSDSGGGAGIQADLKAFAAHGVYGTSAVTAVTAQNTVGVAAIEMVPEALVARQIVAVAEDMGMHAVKTGMLGTASIVASVAQTLHDFSVEKTVIDPVMVAKSGERLIDDAAVRALQEELIPKAYLVTPNLPEAERLVGFACNDEGSIRAAARRIVEMGAKAVVIKGGHASGDESVDLLYTGRSFREFKAARLRTRNTYGTGCTFAAAITARLALGDELEDSVGVAKDYVTRALAGGIEIGRGPGPVDPFAGLTPWSAS